MANELRKNIGRSMHYTQLNKEIDEQIKLQTRTAYDVNAQMQINNLLHQKSINEQQMMQPMSAAEYDEYDDNGQYIGNQTPIAMQTPQTANFGQTLADGVSHAAQGISLGWSDEMHGVLGGIGRVTANSLMRALGQNVNGESFSDAWNKGYQEYRDYARQELQDGYQRNSTISSPSEVGGALASPIKPFKGMIGATANGVIGGVGMTDTNNPTEYALNIGLNTTGSVAGEKFGSILGDKANSFFKDKAKNLSFGLSNIYKPVSIATKFGTNEISNQINRWRKEDD